MAYEQEDGVPNIFKAASAADEQGQQHAEQPQPEMQQQSAAQQPEVQPQAEAQDQPAEQQPEVQQQPTVEQPEPQPEAKQPGAQQPANQAAAQQQPAYQQPANQQPANQRPSYQPPAGQQTSYQQPAGQQQRGYQPPANQQATYQVAAGQQQYAYQAPGAQQAAYQAQPYQNVAYQYAQPAPNMMYVQPKQKKSYSWIVAIVMIVCMFAFTAFCVKTCTDMAARVGGYGSVASEPLGPCVAVIAIDGTIQYDGTACSPEGFKALLDEAAEDDNVKAVVLRVNSGGGTATAGEEMSVYLRNFNKPVVVSSASINASAAYEISAQADYIYVAKSTEIGAIGTAMQLTNLRGLLDMLGVDVEVITSSDSKDSSYGYRALTEEERAYYQNMINQINDMFIENVATGRKMSVDQVRALATGLSFTGLDAVNNGLADEVGTLEDAEAKAAQLAGIDSYEVYDLSFANYDLSSLYDLLGSSENKDLTSLLELLKSQEQETRLLWKQKI